MRHRGAGPASIRGRLQISLPADIAADLKEKAFAFLNPVILPIAEECDFAATARTLHCESTGSVIVFWIQPSADESPLLPSSHSSARPYKLGIFT